MFPIIMSLSQLMNRCLEEENIVCNPLAQKDIYNIFHSLSD